MRLIDADALDEAMTKFSDAMGEDMTHAIFYAHIAPTIDAVPVIRCKDCKLNKSMGDWVECPISEMYGRKASDNYCSAAERKDNG